MRRAEEAVKERTGYDIRLKIKPLAGADASLHDAADDFSSWMASVNDE